MKTIPNVNVLFSNVTESATIAETEAWEEEDLASIANKLAIFPKNESKPRLVVICVVGEVTEYPIIVFPKEKLFGTNGLPTST